MNLAESAARYVRTLCSVIPNRRTGSAGNRAAVAFFAETVSSFGFSVDVTSFPALDYRSGPSSLLLSDSEVDLKTSPYSMPVDKEARLAVVQTVANLETANVGDKILLMLGEICAEQLMPKNFAFYNPEHHKHLIARLEEKKPAGIITATAKSPEQVGALYPYPLIVDGDFDIPNAHCTDELGAAIARRAGEIARLRIQGERIPARASNAVALLRTGSARLDTAARGKVLITAHIDAYEDSPGASDNASGAATLLLIAELLEDYRGSLDIEIVAINGEDHYSAGGEMNYLERYGKEIDRVRLVINIDDIGYAEGGTSWSTYHCDAEVEKLVCDVFSAHPGMQKGEPWWSGDHMVFVQAGRPAVALTATLMPKLMETITHTARDVPEIIDPAKLVVAAQAVVDLVSSLG